MHALFGKEEHFKIGERTLGSLLVNAVPEHAQIYIILRFASN